MPAIIFGLQYEPSMNFYELFVRGTCLDMQEREALKSELKEGYRDWLARRDDIPSVKLKTQMRNVTQQTLYSVLIVPSANDRFKNLYLIGMSPAAIEKTKKDDAVAHDRSFGETDRLIEELISGNPQVLKLAKTKLALLLEKHIDQLPNLLLLGALVAHQKSQRSQEVNATLNPAGEKLTNSIDQPALPNPVKSSSIMGRAFSRLLRGDSGQNHEGNRG